MTITYHREVEQGSDEWKAMRCGILTASEMHLIVSPPARHEDPPDGKPAYVRLKKVGWFWEPSAARMGVVDKVSIPLGMDEEQAWTHARALNKTLPPKVTKLRNDKERAHLYELLGQRITGHVEESYVSDDMLRGRQDELRAKAIYSENYATIHDTGFVTNDEWGFTLGYSPDGLVSFEGSVEVKSRRQKYQIETIVDHLMSGTIPDEHVIQVQTGLLVTRRLWCDYVSYCGGLHMATIRVYVNPEIQEAIITAARDFEERLRNRYDDYLLALSAGVRLVQTERYIEEEIVCDAD